jgi:uncharacterized membrane protein YkoI
MRKTGLLVLLAFASGTSFAANLSRSGAASDLAQTVSYLESRFPGEVIAIAIDDAGDKPAHYHVDMKLPSGTGRWDVDAATRAISARPPAAPAKGAIPLAQAADYAASQLRGDVIAAYYDATQGAREHYDVDVRLSTGAVARLKVDPASRELSWRTPPVTAN